MKLETMINKIREDLGMEVLDNSKQEKMEQLKWDLMFDNIMKICEADDVEFEQQICYIQNDEESSFRVEHVIVPNTQKRKDNLYSLEDRLSKVGIKAKRNTYYEAIQNYKWEEQKKLVNDLCDSEDVGFEICTKVSLAEDGFEVDLIQRIVPEVHGYEGVEEKSLNIEDISLVLNIDSVSYKAKPDKKQVGAIQKRIGACKRIVSLEEFMQAIENGVSFKAGALHGNKNTDWESQQVFALDIDNDDASINKYGLLTPEDACNRFAELRVPPAFYYSSFSSTEERPKFRLIFIVKNPVNDMRVRNAIQMALMNIMPECDKACKDLSRLFFGTNKKCKVYKRKYSILDPYTLIQGMITYIKEKNSSSNACKKIHQYCEEVRLNMINGYPDIQLLDLCQNGKKTTTSIIYNIGHVKNFPRSILFNFYNENDMQFNSAGKQNNNGKRKYSIDIVKVKHKEIRNFNFKTLNIRCRLWREFTDGTKKCNHNQIFGMACNTWNVRGAEKIMVKTINNYNYTNKVNKINAIRSCKSYGYAPMRCTNFCPYCESCPNQGINMLQRIDNKRGQIRNIEDDIGSALSIEDGLKRLQNIITDAFNAGEDTITVIKAPTGIGKTEALKHLNCYDNTVIAYPNHRLGRDIVERLDIADSIHIKELELEDNQIMNEFRRLQQIGAYKQARMFIEKFRNQIMKKYLDGLITEFEKEKVVDRIDEYLFGIKESRITKKAILCTHRKALEIQNKNIDTYIFDEDVVASTVVSTMNITISNLQELVLACDKVKAFNTKEHINLLRKSAIKAQLSPGIPLNISKCNIKIEEVNKLIEYKKDYININLRELMNISAIIADEKGVVSGMSVTELPDKRCIILSATANEAIYKGLFPNRTINFINIDNVEAEGNIVLHYTGCSRSKLAKDSDTMMKKIKTEASGVNNVITFMKFEDRFKKEGFDVITHFGACSGLDSYKGQDLIVAGTPHSDERVYRLLAAIIAGKIELYEKISYINARRNGFEFYFNTYTEGSLLQEIQFYYIESELVQAIGRARVLRTDATVHVFSNYPVRGAVLYNKKIS